MAKGTNLAAKFDGRPPLEGSATEIPDPDLFEDGRAIADALASIMAGADATGSGALAHVYLVENGEDVKIWSGSADDYNLDALAKQHGSGSYRLRVYAPSPDRPTPALRLNKVMKYKLSATEEAKLQAIRRGEIPISGAAPALTEARVAEIVASALRANVPAQPAIDPFAMMRGLADIVRTMQPPAPIAPAVSPLDMLKTTVALFRDLQPARDPIEAGVNAGAGDVMMKLVDKFAPLFMQQMQSSAQPALPAPIPAGSSAGGAPNPVPANSQPGADDMSMRLKMGLSFLVMQAQADNDPATYADMITDNVPEAELRQLFGNPQWLDALAQYEARVKNFPEWFAKLKKEVEASWEPEQPPA